MQTVAFRLYGQVKRDFQELPAPNKADYLLIERFTLAKQRLLNAAFAFSRLLVMFNRN
jgi:hypothetical protein